MQKLIDGEVVDLTPEEEQEVLDRQTAWEADEKPRTISQVRGVVTNHVSSVAKARGYISCTDCTTWANSTIASKRNDADVFSLWRDEVYADMEIAITAYEADERAIDVSTFVDELPEINWDLQLP